jgi:hypothetical protein
MSNTTIDHITFDGNYLESGGGIRGCCAKTKRRGKERYCAQPAIYSDANGEWCYYHRPGRERKFGEGYR